MLRSFVKVNHITNLSDARYCAGMGVDVLGFQITEENFEEDVKNFQSIKDWVSGVEFCAEINFYTPKINELGFTYIESNSKDLVFRYIKEDGLKVIFQIQSDNDGEISDDIINDLPHGSELILHCTKDQKEKLDIASCLVQADGIESNEIQDLLEGSVFGISLTGSDEIRPGFKDYDSLADILELLEED